MKRSKKEGEREKNGGKTDQISSFEENSKSMSKKQVITKLKNTDGANIQKGVIIKNGKKKKP